MAASSPGLESALAYARTHFQDFLSTLKTLCSIPGVTMDEASKATVPEALQKSAAAVVAALGAAGLEGARLIEVRGAPPYAYAEWLGAPGAPTVLVYGHHDVQPPGRQDRWLSPPFEPTERGQRLYGRGTADDKGGFMMHIAAVQSWLASCGRLPVNIRFLIEGEEESGSPHFARLLRQEGKSLKADLLVVSDSANFAVGRPALTYRYRGVCVLDLSLRCLDRPLHSGIFGGAVPDAAQILCKLVASLTDSRGELAPPYFSKCLAPLSRAERASLRALPFDEAVYRSEAGMAEGLELCGSPSASVFERLWARPALALAGLDARPMKEAVPALVDRASLRLVLRTVPDMDSRQAGEALIAWLREAVPFGARLEAKILAALPWWRGEFDGPMTAAASRALRAGYGKEALMVGAGGSLGLVRPFVEALGGPPCILLGVEDPRCGAHSENEGLHLADWRKAIKSMVHLYAEVAATRGQGGDHEATWAPDGGASPHRKDAGARR